MASRTFAINKTPHEATLGDTVLFFEPVVIGAEFAEAYDEIRTIQRKVNGAKGNKASSTKHAKDEDLDTQTLVELSAGMKTFISKFLVPESQPVFRDMRVPDSVLADMMSWVAELYGGGSGNPDAAGGTSSD